MSQIIETSGDIPRVHDPVLAKESGTYYLFSTGRGIATYTSSDMMRWGQRGSVLQQPLQWVEEAIPGARGFWAPDISYFNGKWHLYFSASTFGKNRSAIGLMTNVTLDAARPDYSWTDVGIVIESFARDDWNAIDSNIAFDAEGLPWMVYGSHWSGIKLIEIDAATGKPLQDAHIYALASRRHDPAQDLWSAVEGPYIIYRSGFYYLFVSFDRCCQGVNSTYNIRVGRSSQILGPYTDREGTSMMDGGGTLVLAGSERWRGPGHNSIFREGDTDWLVYHAYDAEDGGASKLRIEALMWDSEGWPHAPSADNAK